MKKSQHKSGLVLYTTKNGAVKLHGDFANETVWGTQQQMAEIFGMDVRTISEHVNNIYKTKELDEKSTIRKFRLVQTEGKRKIEREVKQYNLDMAISVGYRVNSKQATEFRKWATKTLKDHLLKGYTVNEKRLKEHTSVKLKELEKTIALITSVRDKQLSASETSGLLTIIKQYTDTWSTLVAYDEGRLKKVTTKTKGKLPDVASWQAEIANLRTDLQNKNEATEMFARERQNGALEGILGNIRQTFGGQELYPSFEEKAAHLLYFIIKDHPFTDGNKRTGAFVFLRFLQLNNRLVSKNGEKKINDAALTAITLLVAASDPREKEVMIALITRLIS